MVREDTSTPKVQRALSRGDALTTSQLVERTGLTWPAVTSALRRLEDSGEIVREREAALTLTHKHGNGYVWKLKGK